MIITLAMTLHLPQNTALQKKLSDDWQDEWEVEEYEAGDC